MMDQSKVNEAVTCFGTGYSAINCAQAIFSTYCEEFGLDKKTAMQIACGLGAGMARMQKTCGAVSGAYLLIGLKHGSFSAEDAAAKEKTYALVQEFTRQFTARNKTTKCLDLLGMDLIKDDKQIVSERVKAVCPKLVQDAAEIIEELLFSAE
jgi:C_GCAxxG_C_C family probable redox protein